MSSHNIRVGGVNSYRIMRNSELYPPRTLTKRLFLNFFKFTRNDERVILTGTHVRRSVM